MEEKGDLLDKVYGKRDRFFRWLGLGEDGIYLVAGGLSVLFIANTGAILGVDLLLSRKIPFALLVAQPQFELKYLWVEKLSFLGLVFVSGLIALYATFYVTDWSPTSVKDPAMIIVVLATFGGLASFVTFLRLQWIGWGRPLVWGR